MNGVERLARIARHDAFSHPTPTPDECYLPGELPLREVEPRELTLPVE